MMDKTGVVILSVLVLAMGLMIWVGIQSTIETNRLIAECIADGKKEYECKAMFKVDTVVMPVVVR